MSDLDDRSSIMGAATRLAENAQRVARAEINLLQQRALDKAQVYKAAAIYGVIAAVLGFAALLTLLVGLLMILTPHVGPIWATVIVVGVVGLIAFIFVRKAMAALEPSKD